MEEMNCILSDSDSDEESANKKVLYISGLDYGKYFEMGLLILCT